MDMAIGALLLVVAIIGLALLLGSFGVLMYALYKRSQGSEGRAAAPAGEGRESGQ